MKHYAKSPLPSQLKSVPKGYVYLGKGGRIQDPPRLRVFQGYCMSSDNTFNESIEEGTVVKDWCGTAGYFYFAPADSEIARLNGLVPRKRKVAPKVAPKPKITPLPPKITFPDSLVYLGKGGEFKLPPEGVFTGDCSGGLPLSVAGLCEVTGKYSNLYYFAPIGSPVAILNGHQPAPVAPPAPPIFHKPCGRGGIPIPPVTIGDVWDAFKAYAAQYGHSLDAIQLCKDGSGMVMDTYDKPVFHFADLPEALAQLKTHTK